MYTAGTVIMFREENNGRPESHGPALVIICTARFCLTVLFSFAPNIIESVFLSLHSN